MKRRAGSKECFLYREESGFGWKRHKVWKYGTFKFKELKQLFSEGWIEDKRLRRRSKKTA
ncbi:hypothetical protein P4V01_24840 [Bacillus thuringiensis]|nr:hypothetical protein [Bacillus thuringiensis]